MSTMAKLMEPPPSSSTEIGRVTFPNAIPVQPLAFDRKHIKIHSKEVIDKAKAVLIKEFPKFTGTANWLYSVNDWVKYSSTTGAACHANLPRMDQSAYDTVVATENGWNRIRKNAKNLSPAPFLSWLLYYSPYGEFILNRDDFDHCLNYGFVFSGSLPQPIAMNLCIITRHFYECTSSTFEKFNELTAQGYDPTLCYSMLFNSNLSMNGYYENYKWSGCNGHRVTMAYCVNVLRNIYNGVYGANLSTDSMAKNGTIWGASKLFDYSDQYETTFSRWATKDVTFQSALSEFRNKDVKEPEVYRPPNPFKRVDYNDRQQVLREGEFTQKECIEFVIPYVDSLLRKDLNIV